MYFDFEALVNTIETEKLTSQELFHLKGVINGKLATLPNSIEEWVESKPIILNRTTKFVYDNYVKFCVLNELDYVNVVVFGRQLRKKYGYVSKVVNDEGVSVRIYVKS